MSKRTLILIGLLVIVSGALLFTAAYQGRKQQMQQTAMPIVTPPVVGHTVLTMVPGTPVGTTNTVNINVDSMGDNVTAVQAEIVYNPQQVMNVKVNQGTFFTNPIVLFNQIDPKNGRISYAIGIHPLDKPQKGAGTVATITYTTAYGIKGPITFTFLPKTKATAEGVAQSVLKTANSLTITSSTTAK